MVPCVGDCRRSSRTVEPAQFPHRLSLKFYALAVRSPCVRPDGRADLRKGLLKALALDAKTPAPPAVVVLSFDHSTTKLPAASAASAGETWVPHAIVLPWNSLPCGEPLRPARVLILTGRSA
jgi:hypothetical protein